MTGRRMDGIVGPAKDGWGGVKKSLATDGSQAFRSTLLRDALSTRGEVVVAIAILFTNLAIDTMNADFLSIVFGNLDGTLNSFFLSAKIARTALGVLLNCRPMVAPLYDMNVFAHI